MSIINKSVGKADKLSKLEEYSELVDDENTPVADDDVVFPPCDGWSPPSPYALDDKPDNRDEYPDEYPDNLDRRVDVPDDFVLSSSESSTITSGIVANKSPNDSLRLAFNRSYRLLDVVIGSGRWTLGTGDFDKELPAVVPAANFTPVLLEEPFGETGTAPPSPPVLDSSLCSSPVPPPS